MGSIFDKNRTINSVFWQMLIIIIAFAIMGISSFFFASGIERKHLVNDAEQTLAFTEADITAELREPGTYFSGYSETIRSMLIRNETAETLSLYITAITNFILNDNDHLTGFVNSHGYFYSLGGIYISGREIELPKDFNPMETPWYIRAIFMDGKIAVVAPYTGITGKQIITFSRLLKDDDGNPLAVFCLDIEFDKIFKRAITANLTESSYGLLLNSNLEIMAHRVSDFIGRKFNSINSGLAELTAELEMGQNINERKIKNYMYEDSIVYFRRVEFDWVLGIVIPVHEYYRSVNNMAAFLIILGSILAAVLCIMMYQISQAKKKSDLRTQQKSNFLATMSHEIRTPLNAILGMTEIQMQNAMHPPATSEAFMKINNSGNLLLNIVNDILDLSKIEAGKLELVPVKYQVASLINDIVQLNYIRYESKPIEFIIDIDENIPSTLIGDELRIKQIMNNLLSNAFKYTDKGAVTLSVNAECVGRGGVILVTLIFQVKDTGQGMTPGQVSRLFDEYTRFNLEANRTTEGAGLGMTITRNLVDLMFGKINVKSAVGEGTTVAVRLPQKNDGIGIRGVIGKEMAETLRHYKIGNAIQLKKAQITHEHMPYGSVLIVDDVETNLYVAKGLMAPYGLKIDLATSGFEAIEKVKSGGVYDVIFMDHMMPKLDGIETTRLLRKMGYVRPIVALTANAITGQAEVFLKNGFDGFISKPIDIRQLNVSLNKLIRDKQPVEVVEAAQRERAELEKKQANGNVQKDVDPQLAEIFARDAEKAATVLETIQKSNFREEEDIHLYVINVHAMKSALANVGETELSAVALRLEQAGREKDLNVMKFETPEFLEKLRKTIEKIKPKDEENEAGEDTEEALVLLSEKLVKIKDACAAFDKKAAKTSLNELREKTWSNKNKELLNKIAEYLLHSEFDKAAALAEKNIKK